MKILTMILTAALLASAPSAFAGNGLKPGCTPSKETGCQMCNGRQICKPSATSNHVIAQCQLANNLKSYEVYVFNRIPALAEIRSTDNGVFIGQYNVTPIHSKSGDVSGYESGTDFRLQKVFGRITLRAKGISENVDISGYGPNMACDFF